MNCSYLKCPNKPEFQCDCKNFVKFLCKIHLPEHISDQSSIHNPYNLSITQQENTSNIIIKTLLKEKQNCQLNIKNLVSSFTSLQKQLDITLKSHLKELISFSKDLDSLIITILQYPEKIVDGNLKRTLGKNSALAKIECEKWKIVNIKGSVENISKSIKDLSLVDIDMSWIYGLEDDFNDLMVSKSTSFSPQIPVVKQPQVPVAKQPQVPVAKQPQVPVVKQPQVPVVKQPQIPATRPPQENMIRQSVPVRSNQVITAKMTCPNNHEYKWTPYAPHFSFLTKKSYDLECSLCEREFSKSCWRCQTCNIYACEQCSNAIGIPCPKLVCSNKHELVYRGDVNEYYESKGLGNGYACKNCFKRKTDSHWHCRSCNYDICTECGRTAGFDPFTKPPVCTNNHNLNTIVIDNLTWSSHHICAICKSSATGLVYFCIICSYYQCEYCYILLRNSISYHPSVMCPNSHFLNWAREISYKCPYCLEQKDDGYWCRQCDSTMCGDCSMILVMIFMENQRKIHGQEKHVLTWIQKPWTIFSMNEFNCLICKDEFSNVGMFACKACMVFVCLRCFNDPDRPKKQQIPERISIADLNNLNNLNNLNDLLIFRGIFGDRRFG